MKRNYSMRKIASVQIRIALKMISGFCTISEAAALVLASVLPIELLVKEKQEIYLQNNGEIHQLESQEDKKQQEIRH